MFTSTQKVTPLHLPHSNGDHMSFSEFGHSLDLIKLLQPETKLERVLLETPEFKEGMNWGKPRYGHPEGKVGLHVLEVLSNIENLHIDKATRSNLRLLAFVHDTFKFQEMKSLAHGKRIHHAQLARDFLTNYVDDKNLLDILELHDEAFYIWRQLELKSDLKGAMTRLKGLFNRLDDALPLYFLFFKCDTETGDKTMAPLRWFEATVQELASEEAKAYLKQCIEGKTV